MPDDEHERLVAALWGRPGGDAFIYIAPEHARALAGASEVVVLAGPAPTRGVSTRTP
jgi:hypothetical protein